MNNLDSAPRDWQMGTVTVLMALNALYMFKVIYGLAVDHYARRETWRHSAVG